MRPPRRSANFCASLLAVATATLSAQTKIACLGDSITYGARLPERANHSYPAQLAALRPKDEVRNFGIGGATLLLLADRPLVATDSFATAIAWQPDVAIVMLGTNDTCQNQRRRNWEHHADLAANAQLICRRLLAANPDVRIVLTTPPAMFADQKGLEAARRKDLQTRALRLPYIARALQSVANRTPHDHIDYLELRNTLQARHVVDGVHPNPFGQERIARRIDELLRTQVHRDASPIAGPEQWLAAAHISSNRESFHGFSGASFELRKSKARCKVFAPHTIANGKPWILRARFFGHQPALDIALLERGFHLAYCDVAGLYGNDQALARWDELYELLVAGPAALNQRVVLEGMSRGGLPIINWAAAHPERIAAIYGDNPVADFRSWPGGTSGKRSEQDWQRCLNAYGLDEQAANSFPRMPIDRLAPIAAAKIPLLLVLGMADKVVPAKENGTVLARRYRELGGPVEVWRKPGLGHHPHGLHPVDPLLRAVLHASTNAALITTTPAPSAEYRGGAGWNGDSWHTQVAKMRALAKQHADTPIVFLGDSITQGLTGATDRIATTNGTRAFDKAFGKHGAIALGLSGDRTEHILYRIEHGALQELSPKVIVLQIGVNNVVTGKHTAREVSEGIFAIARSITMHEPQARLVVCGPFPARKRGTSIRQTIDQIHAAITPSPNPPPKQTHDLLYMDLRHLFLDDNGDCNQNMRGDRLHINASGQQAWMQALQPVVERLLLPR